MTEITLDIRNLMTFTDAAKALGVSRPTVYNLVERNRLHPLAIGNNRYLLREEVEQVKERLERKEETEKATQVNE